MNNKDSKICFIGCGNMGSSIIGGLIKSGYSSSLITGIEPDEQKCQVLNRDLGVSVYSENHHAIPNSDVLVLAVKPQVLINTLQTIKEYISEDCLIMSIAAGVNCQSIQKTLSNNAAVIRVMPNTPCLINLGASSLYASDRVSDEQKNIAEMIMSSVGISVWVEKEELIDAVTAISGSGPAYYFLFMEIFLKAAEKMGLEPEAAKKLVYQTALGAANMAMTSEQTVEKLRKNVTSAGGTTEAAINSMLDDNIEKILTDAVQDAEKRSKELAKLMDK